MIGVLHQNYFVTDDGCCNGRNLFSNILEGCAFLQNFNTVSLNFAMRFAIFHKNVVQLLFATNLPSFYCDVI